MAIEDGPEILLRAIIEGLRGIRRGAGYEHTFKVWRGRRDIASFSPSEDEVLYVETSEDVPETREDLAGHLADCTLGIDIWVAKQDPPRGPGDGPECHTSQALNAAIRDVLKRMYASDWDAPTWAEGRGHVKTTRFPRIERYIDHGNSLKLARIVCEVSYEDSNEFA